MQAQTCIFAVCVPMARGQMPNGSPGVFRFGVKKKKKKKNFLFMKSNLLMSHKFSQLFLVSEWEGTVMCA